jgi:hypothetical protein
MKQGIPRIKPVSQPIITVCIVPGKATPAMKTAWRAWWRCLIASVREESDSKAKRE